MSTCPTCGQPVAGWLDANALLALLRDGVPHRETYVGRDGNWYVTYGGGRTSLEAVQDLRRRGLIQPVYSVHPEISFHVGKTLDMPTTLARRKESGDRTLLVYTDGEIGHLEPRDRPAIARARRREITQAEAARELGISRQRVHQIVHR